MRTVSFFLDTKNIMPQLKDSMASTKPSTNVLGVLSATFSPSDIFIWYKIQPLSTPFPCLKTSIHCPACSPSVPSFCLLTKAYHLQKRTTADVFSTKGVARV
ncbi:hypothetical protein JTE90_017101 [Oedothorax gibbosus]|uniref:Uncharacterized protein n=1 Tax=Oedothorax gibbosus TaxID=931172 RepID=A0AAV6UG52_9ARAC|nr:hypothetical protein JTE90_017101 [Oedothorax gibbosus]